MRLVLVDVDGTLIQAATERGFIAFLRSRGALGAAQIASFAWFALRYALRYGGGVWRKNKAYLNGLECARIEAFAAEYVQDSILARVHPEMRAAVSKHNAAGDVVVLLTGTPDFIARPIADALAIKRIAATRCACDAGRFTGAPPLEHPFGADKLRIARALSEELDLPLEASWAYGDALSDAALLAAVGHPVAVRPAPALRRLALARGWTVLA